MTRTGVRIGVAVVAVAVLVVSLIWGLWLTATIGALGVLGQAVPLLAERRRDR